MVWRSRSCVLLVLAFFAAILLLASNVDANGYLYGTDANEWNSTESRLLRIDPQNASSQVVGTVENLYLGSQPLRPIVGLAFVPDFKWVGAGTGGKTATDPSDPATLWSGQANWQIGVVPGASDTAYVTLVNTGYVYAESASVGPLYVDGTSTDAALRIRPGVDFHVTRALHVGQNVAGKVMQTGGTCRVDDDLHLGQPGVGRGTYALYSGTLSVDGNLVNDGELRVGPFPNVGDGVHIHGDYVQSGSGTLFVELLMDTRERPTPAVVVDGKALLDGTLEVQLSGGVQPTVGQRFGVMSYDSVQGRFETFKGSAIDGRPDIFLGLDYNKQSLSVMTLKVPTRANGTPMSANRKTDLILVTHGWEGNVAWGTTAPTALEQVAAGMSAFAASDPAIDSHWDVVVMDWSEFAKTGLDPGPDEAARRASQIGQSLANWMAEGSMAYTNIHLLGHSAGAWLIDGVADRLRELGYATDIQLTFFDAFVPPSLVSTEGFPGAYNHATRAEQYVDVRWSPVLQHTNVRLPNAVNINVTDLDPWPWRLPGTVHDWPHTWYLSTLDDPTAERAYGWGFVRSPLYCEYAGVSPSLAPLGPNDWLDLPSGRLRANPLRVPMNPANGTTVVSDTGTVTMLPDGTFTLATGSPVMLTTFLDFQGTAYFLSFDFEFHSQAEGLLSVFFEGQEILEIDERDVPPGQWNSGDVWLGGDYGPGTYALLFRLDPYSDLQSIVEISNLEVGFTPEPATLSLLALGALAVLGRRRSASS